MGASLLPSGADSPRDPVLGQIRQFAAQHGVSAPAPGGSLTPVWAQLRATGIEFPGLAYAEWAETLALGGMLTSILANNPTVGSMLQDLERFHPLLDRDRIVLSRHSGAMSVTLRTPADGPADPDTVDAVFGMLARSTMRLAGRLPIRVHLRRTAPADPGCHRRLLGEVAFGQRSDRCTFDPSTLDSALTNADPAVLELVRPYAHRRMAHASLPWTHAVTRALSADPLGMPGLREVAKALAVSPRTLQTRLAEEGRRFVALAEAVQNERAKALLAEPGIPIATVAVRCGFATSAAFTRAFRRWTATTPSRYRASVKDTIKP